MKTIILKLWRLNHKIWKKVTVVTIYLIVLEVNTRDNWKCHKAIPLKSLPCLKSLKVINGYQRSSRSSTVINGHQRSSTVINGHQLSSTVIEGNQNVSLNVLSKCPIKMSHQNVPSMCPIKTSHQYCRPICHIKMSHQNDPSNAPSKCPIKMSHQHIPPKYPIKISH